MKLLHIIYKAWEETQSTPNLTIEATMRLHPQTFCYSMLKPTQQKCHFPLIQFPYIRSVLLYAPVFIVFHPLFSLHYVFSKKTANFFWLKSNLINLCRISFLVAFIKKNSITHVNVFYGDSGEVFAELKKILRVKLFLSFHGCDSSAPFLQRCRMLKKYYDAYFVLCDFMKNDLIVNGIKPEKIYMVKTGLNFGVMDVTGETPRKYQILFVGRLVEKKGIFDALAAFARIAEKYERLQFVVVGDGPLEADAKRLAGDLTIADNVVFCGHLKPKSVYENMRESLIFFLPSKIAHNQSREGTPCAIIEAQALGLPVVSTVHAGIPEIVIDGQTALLSAEGDIDGFVKSLDLLLSDNKRLQTFAHQAKKYALENYPIEKRAGTLLDLYQKI